MPVQSPVTSGVPKPEKEPEDIFAFQGETAPTPERPVEVRVEQPAEKREAQPEVTPVKEQPEVAVVHETPTSQPVPVQALPVQAADQQLVQVEKILAEGLEEIYKTLPPAEQQRFRIEGEKAAQEVASLMGQVKVRVQQIITIIRKWLSVLPGVNKYFIEQEAKIKAQRILLLRDPEKL